MLVLWVRIAASEDCEIEKVITIHALIPDFFGMKPLGVFNCFFQLHHRYPFTLPGGERGTVRVKFLTQHNDRISTQISRSGILRANH